MVQHEAGFLRCVHLVRPSERRETGENIFYLILSLTWGAAK
jgi:hypothetical protein